MPIKLRDHSTFNLKSKPYTLLGVAGFFMGILSFIPMHRDALDINLHDTYFVIADFSFYRLFAALLLFLWTVYVAASRALLSRRLSWIHIIATLLPIILFLIPTCHLCGMSGVPRRYYALSDFQNREPLYNIVAVYIAITLAFIIGQLIFVVNLAWGTVKLFRQN